MCPLLFLLLGHHKWTEESEDKPEMQYPMMSVCQAGVKQNMC